MAKVVWTKQADRWLLKIHDYIARDSPENASRVVESIYRRAQILADCPDVGHSYASATGRKLRILLWGRYRIVCHRPKDDEVHVIGVFHGAMNMSEYLR